MRANFFASLFDFSFKTMITPTIVKVLYALVVAAAGLFALSLLLSGIAASRVGGVFGLLTILAAPVGFFFVVIYGRVMLEVVITFFKIGDDVSQIRERALE